MDVLDLRRHQPADLAGKVLTMGGRDYEVGPLFRQSDQGFAHPLVNRISGLTHMVAQFRPSYLSAPEVALHAARTKQSVNADLRWHLQNQQPPVATPVVTCIEANGGSFELHEIGYSPGPDTSVSERTAIQLRAQGRHGAALAILRELLALRPDHTEAMIEMARCHQAMNQPALALPLFERAVSIEPNYWLYRVGRMSALQSVGEQRLALDAFIALHANRPHVNEAHLPGAHAALCCGEPDRALDVLARTVVVGKDADALREKAKQAAASRQLAQQHLSTHGWTPQHADFEGADYLGHLEQALKLYTDDPVVRANLGFALQERGQFDPALKLLIHSAVTIERRFAGWCHVNAAFCLAQMERWDAAFELLAPFAEALFAGQTHPAVHTVPGIARWIGPLVVAERAGDLAAQLTNGVIENNKGTRVMAPAMFGLAALYKEAARLGDDN